MKTVIKIVNNKSNTAKVILVDGKLFASKAVLDDDTWIKLIDTLTEFEITKKEVSDEDMEKGKLA